MRTKIGKLPWYWIIPCLIAGIAIGWWHPGERTAFTAALESMYKPRFMIGKIPPTPGLVDQFFNTSTGQGEDGEIDARGPWNEGGDFTFVEAPAFQSLMHRGESIRSVVVY